MQYHQFTIHTYRPFISKERLRSSRAVTPLHRGNYVQARAICIQSAVAISALVRRYRSLYGLRMANLQIVHIIFSAAIILVFASSVSDLGGADSAPLLMPHLDECSQALVELGATFRNAGRTLDMLLAIKRQWQAKLLVSIHTAQGRRAPGPQDGSP